MSGRTVYSHSIVIFPSDDTSLAAVLASSIHEVWARKYGSYNLLLLRYAPSDIFDTFVLPPFGTELRAIGAEYYDLREHIMRTRDIGLTRIYNEFHDPSEVSGEIRKLRTLQIELDRQVAESYKWKNIDMKHDFYETEQGIRFTVSSDARSLVLEHLLKLNHKQFQEEMSAGLHRVSKKQPAKAGKNTSTASINDGVLFPVENHRG